jgi:hypothetical protein
MGEFCLLYLLCMLRFPVPLHSLQEQRLAPLQGVRCMLGSSKAGLPISRCICTCTQNV